jgi:predicted nucleotidyltransferase
MAMTQDDKLLARQVAAVERAAQAIRILSARGVKMMIFGSLARGDVRLDSDVDFMVMECPRDLIYAFEGTVEDCMQDIPFDVVYYWEVAPHRLPKFSKDLIDIEELLIRYDVPSVLRETVDSVEEPSMGRFRALS